MRQTVRVRRAERNELELIFRPRTCSRRWSSAASIGATERRRRQYQYGLA